MWRSLRDLLQQGVLGLPAHVVFLGGVFGAAAGGVSPGTVVLVCALQPMVVTVAGRVGWGYAIPLRQIVGLVAGLGAVVGALAWLVLLSGIGGYAGFVTCLRTRGSTTTSLLLYLTPPVTSVWAWVMFGLAPSVARWLGLLLGAVAVAWVWPRGGTSEIGQGAVRVRTGREPASQGTHRP